MRPPEPPASLRQRQFALAARILQTNPQPLSSEPGHLPPCEASVHVLRVRARSRRRLCASSSRRLARGSIRPGAARCVAQRAAWPVWSERSSVSLRAPVGGAVPGAVPPGLDEVAAGALPEDQLGAARLEGCTGRGGEGRSPAVGRGPVYGTIPVTVPPGLDEVATGALPEDQLGAARLHHGSRSGGEGRAPAVGRGPIHGAVPGA